jgi:methionyl-tRNA synthetase
MKMNSKLINAPKKFYITTPIYYGNDKFHLGHAYTTICADVFARYYRLIGTNVFFLTGIDEHGLKVQQSAEKQNKNPKDFLDELAIKVKELWKSLDISYDYLIRTTDENHKELVENISQKMYENKDIYLGEYEGWYCKGCESYFTEKDLVDGKCPYGHQVTYEKEPAYFFKLSKYQDWLLNYYIENPDFIQPKSRKNEMIAFIKQGLKDLCISRKSVSWGIKLPFNKDYTIYVWLDALFNYLSALNYPLDNKFIEFWPPDFQLMGKEIFKFHAIFWPIFLKSVNLDIPKVEFAHGWWTVEGKKMSKSFGNVIYPETFVNKYGLDIFRYYLLREMSFGEDGSFCINTFHERINNELVASIGNLFNRVITLAKKRDKSYTYYKNEFSNKIEQQISLIDIEYKNKNLSKVLVEIMNISSLANKFVQDNEPWKLLKTDPIKFDKIMYVLLETLRLLALELSPILTTKYKEMFEQLGLDINNNDYKKLEYSNIMENKIVNIKNHLFTKVE